MNIHTPAPGSPNPKSPKRNTHPNIAIIITRLMPNLRKQKGMSRMQRVSLICERLMSALAFCAPKVSANSGISLKEVMKGLAYPFVICKLTPSNMEKMKNTAILRCLNRRKASSPSPSTMLRFSPAFAPTGHAGSV